MLEYIFIKISQASVLLPIIAGLRSYKFLSRPFRIFILLFVACGMLEIAGMIMKKEYSNNMPAYNLVPFFEFYFITMLYMHHFASRKYYQSFFVVSIAVFTAIGILDLVLLHGLWKQNTYAHGLESFLLVIYSLLYFHDHFTKAPLVNTSLQPMFFINAGVFIYFPLNLLLFFIANYLIENEPALADAAFNIHCVFNIVLNTCFAWAFICYRKQAA